MNFLNAATSLTSSSAALVPLGSQKWNSTVQGGNHTLPTLSTLERLHIEAKLVEVNDQHTVDLSAPTLVADALLALRTNLPRDAFDPSLQTVFDRFFTRSSFSVRRLDQDHANTNMLIDMLARDKVHPIVNDNDKVEQRRTDPHTLFFGMFHLNRPVMLLQVSLQTEIPYCLDQIFASMNAERGNTVAVFYSISLLEDGLVGLGFGEQFLHAVVKELRETHRSIATFVTMSPMPLFRQWLADRDMADVNPDQTDLLMPLAAQYLVPESGVLIDPVARFHMSNGAQLYRINHHPSNLEESYGCMVNYLYDMKLLKERKENFPLKLAINDALFPQIKENQ